MNKYINSYITYLVLTILDCIFTTVFVNKYGINMEFNPVVYWVIDNYSYVGLWCFKVLVATVAYVIWDNIFNWGKYLINLFTAICVVLGFIVAFL